MEADEIANPAEDPDIAFLFAECIRLHEMMETMGLGNFVRTVSKADSAGVLELSNGRKIFCGTGALQRLRDRTTRALRKSEISGTVQPEAVYRALKRVVIQRFFEQRVAAEITAVEDAVEAALEEAKRSCVDLLYYIPCRLMKIKEPNTISIGPITLYAREVFEEKAAPLYEQYVSRGENDRHRDICALLANKARHYYEGFTWVAEVKVFACDPATSRERADLAARAALDVLHLLLGAECTGRMYVGGPRLPDDPRAILVVDIDGHLDVSCSHDVTSEVGFGDSLRKFFEREDVTSLIAAAGKALEPLVNPRIQRPLGLRMVEALAWFGDAAREQTDAARIVKATNALERLLATLERKDGGVTKAFSRRGAAVSYGGPSAETFDELEMQFREAYGLRSRLAHGSASPFDPEVSEQAPTIMRLARRALCCALGLFEQRRLFDRIESDAELPQWLDALTEETRALESAILVPPPILEV